MVVTGNDSEGWWTGTNAIGVSGVFPNNYVEELFDDEDDDFQKESTPSEYRAICRFVKNSKIMNSFTILLGLSRRT